MLEMGKSRFGFRGTGQTGGGWTAYSTLIWLPLFTLVSPASFSQLVSPAPFWLVPF